jgi:hypothetical protein
MNIVKIILGSAALLLVFSLAASAQLTVTVSPPKTVGQKAVIKLAMKNTFTEKIESARAQVFLLDDQGRVVGRAARWVIGGTKDKPPLAPDAETTFNFVVDADTPFATSSVTFTRLILEDGKLADVKKEVTITPAATSR